MLLPGGANRAFRRSADRAYLCVAKAEWVFSAGTGTLNLNTGVVTRLGAPANQLAIYGIDAATVAILRAAPAIGSILSR